MTLPVCSKSPCDRISEPPCSKGKIWRLEVSANVINTVLALAHLEAVLKSTPSFYFFSISQEDTIVMIGDKLYLTLEGSLEALSLRSAEVVQRLELYKDDLKLSHRHTHCKVASIPCIK